MDSAAFYKHFGMVNGGKARKLRVDVVGLSVVPIGDGRYPVEVTLVETGGAVAARCHASGAAKKHGASAMVYPDGKIAVRESCPENADRLIQCYANIILNANRRTRGRIFPQLGDSALTLISPADASPKVQGTGAKRKRKRKRKRERRDCGGSCGGSDDPGREADPVWDSFFREYEPSIWT